MVRNDGRSAAGAFDVALSVNDAPQPIQRLGGLGSHALEVVSFVAPRCAPGSVVRFVLDASFEVAEASEDDNVIEQPCPWAR